MRNNFKKFGLSLVLLFLIVGFSGCEKSDSAKVDNGSSDEQVVGEAEVSKNNSNEKKEERKYFAIARDIEKRFGIDEDFYFELVSNGDSKEEIKDCFSKRNKGLACGFEVQKCLIKNNDSNLSHEINKLDINNFEIFKNEDLGYEIKIPEKIVKIKRYEKYDEFMINNGCNLGFFQKDVKYKSLEDFLSRFKGLTSNKNYIKKIVFGNNTYYVIPFIDRVVFVSDDLKIVFVSSFFDVNGIDLQVFYEILKSYKEI